MVAAQVNEFWWPVRVYYEDTDNGGVVYYANYLKYLERARTEWLRALGVEQDALATTHGVIFAVRTVAVDFLRPARFNDTLRISVAIPKHGGASVDFSQTVVRGAAETLCTAQVRVACLDAKQLRPRPLPKFIRHLLIEVGVA